MQAIFYAPVALYPGGESLRRRWSSIWLSSSASRNPSPLPIERFVRKWNEPTDQHVVEKRSFTDRPSSAYFHQVKAVDNPRRKSMSNNLAASYCRHMLLGYCRVSGADQNPAHQVDALRRAGLASKDIHVDHASGAKASRPQLDLLLRLLRNGDVLVITRLDRLGRSVLHLITLGAQLRERGVGLRVLDQGIDTATAEGRAMFGMLSVLAELQRELIVANTRDGLAAARARGRKGGRPARLSADQIALAQRLYDAREHTVAQIAAILNVPRTTVYGHLTTPAATTTGVEIVSAATAPTPNIAPPPDDPPTNVRPPQSRRTDRACPSCGHEPTTRAEASRPRRR